MTELARAIEAQAHDVDAMLGRDLEPAVERLRPAERIWLVGTGTSQHAAELGTWMASAGPRPVQAVSAATFAWSTQTLSPDDAVVVISHTGETAFANRARQRALDAGARLISITAEGSPWPEAVQTVARERSETYTTSYLAALVVLARLGLELGQAPFDAAELGRVPAAVQAAAGREDELGTRSPRLVVVTGVGPGAVTAREGALKLREAARVLAEGFEAEYLLHGSAVPLGRDDALVALQSAHDEFGLLAQLADAAESEGMSVLRIDDSSGLHPVLAQLPLTVRLQRLASQLADARGVDPDTVITGAWERDGLWEAGLPATSPPDAPTEHPAA